MNIKKRSNYEVMIYHNGEDKFVDIKNYIDILDVLEIKNKRISFLNSVNWLLIILFLIYMVFS